MEDDSSFEEDFTDTFENSDEVEPSPPKKAVKKDDNSFEILSIEHILEEAFEKVNEVRSFLQLQTTDSAIRALLTHYKWDHQRLIGEFWEMDRDTFFEQAKVSNPFKSLPAPTDNNVPDDSNTCTICCEEGVDLFGLDCLHKFCRDCWGQYLTTKIVEDGLNQSISCLARNCGFLVDDEHVLLFVDDPDVITKYQRSMSNTFVQHNKSIRWCPSLVGCTFAAKKKRTTKYPCKCTCGFEFCFDCTAEYWHEPVTCAKLKQWKSSGDTETFQWIAEHAKPCPNCESNIEKNGGCNHMTCRSCRHEFCWVCMGNWRGHNACNRFDDTKVFAQKEIARFKHFQDRYGNQLESLRLEGILYRDLESKIDDMKYNFTMTNNEVRFLRDAVKVLHVSRRTLTYTFVFAYFLKKNNHVDIFEENQKDLEIAVERLSGYLEQEMTEDSVVELKKNIQDSFKYCEQRCNVLMEHIREAEEEGLWQMS